MKATTFHKGRHLLMGAAFCVFFSLDLGASDVFFLGAICGLLLSNTLLSTGLRELTLAIQGTICSISLLF